MKTKAMAVLLSVLLALACVACAKPTAETMSAQELLDLGRKFLMDMKYEQALVFFNKAIEVEPNNTAAYQGLAETYIALEEKEKAFEALQTALGYEPENAVLLSLLDGVLADVSPDMSVPTPAAATAVPAQTVEVSFMPVPTPSPSPIPGPTPSPADAGGVAWHEPILEAYRTAMRQGDTNESGENEILNREALSLALWSGVEIYYALYDIDGNGTLELVIGPKNSNGECFDVFVYDGNQPVRLFHGDSTGLDMTFGYRMQLYLCEDGAFLACDEINHDISPDQYGTTYYYCRLGNDGCTPEQTACVYSEWTEVGGRRYFLMQPGEDIKEISESDEEAMRYAFFEKIPASQIGRACIANRYKTEIKKIVTKVGG